MTPFAIWQFLRSPLGLGAVIALLIGAVLLWVYREGGQDAEDTIRARQLQDHADTVTRKNQIEEEVRNAPDDELRRTLGAPVWLFGDGPR